MSLHGALGASDIGVQASLIYHHSGLEILIHCHHRHVAMACQHVAMAMISLLTPRFDTIRETNVNGRCRMPPPTSTRFMTLLTLQALGGQKCHEALHDSMCSLLILRLAQSQRVPTLAPRSVPATLATSVAQTCGHTVWKSSEFNGPHFSFSSPQLPRFCTPALNAADSVSQGA